jgi:hypothetical protein
LYLKVSIRWFVMPRHDKTLLICYLAKIRLA